VIARSWRIAADASTVPIAAHTMRIAGAKRI